uniref:GDP-mannose 4,6-dehydratase n=1 Tax=Anaerostipes sp. TaxID=1872530 RepID=UPI0025900270|nr:GDP-mannose 4,6-dehydratase [Anaerostipes sp.]
MKVLVTGGAGFIGGNFVHHMVNKYPDYQIVNLDLLTYAGNLETLKPVEDKPNYKFVKGDIADEAFIMDLFEKEKFEDYKTDLGTDSSVTPDFTEADDFLKFIQKNRRSVPSKERIADKDKFIKTVYELSNSFEIDADLIKFAEGYIANIYVDYACYTGYIKKLLAILFILADDISFLDGSKENADMLFSFTYHTHHIFLNNRETTDFS